KALERMDALARENPQDVDLQRSRAAANMRLGVVNRHLREPIRAREHFSKALDDFEQVTKSEPKNVQAKVDLAACYGNCGNLDKQVRDFATAVEHFAAGVGILQDLEARGVSAQQVQLKAWLANQQRDLESCKDVLRAVDDIGFASTKQPKYAGDLLTLRAMVLADRG